MSVGICPEISLDFPIDLRNRHVPTEDHGSSLNDVMNEGESFTWINYVQIFLKLSPRHFPR
jgi:hypothetical protein